MDIDLASEVRFEDGKAFLGVAGQANQVYSLFLAKCALGQIVIGLLHCCVFVAIKRNERWYFRCGIQRNH